MSLDFSLNSDIGITAMTLANASQLFTEIMLGTVITSVKSDEEVLSRNIGESGNLDNDLCVDFFIQRLNSKLVSKINGVF